MHSWSIKTRFSIAVFVLFIIALGSIVLAVLAELHDKYQRTIGENMALLATTHAVTLDTRFANATQTLQKIADGLPKNAFARPEQAQAYAKQQKFAVDTFDLGIYIADEAEVIIGELLADPIAGHARLGMPSASSDTNKHARSSGKPSISRAYASPSCGGCPAVVLVTPVFSEKQVFLGYVAGAIRLDGTNFLAALRQVKIGKGGYFYLMTPERAFVMHPDPARVLGPIVPVGKNKLVDEVFGGQFKPYGYTVNSIGMHQIVGFHFMQSTGWLLAAVYSADEAEAPFGEAQTKVVLMASMIGLLMLIATWLTIRRLLAPLSILSQHVSKIPATESPQPINLNATGEIGNLETAFNGMVDELAKQQAQRNIKEAEISALNHELATTNGTLTETIEHLNTTRQELVRAEKLSALGSLVAGVAHELNTPIGNCVLITSKLTEENRSLSSEVENGQLRRSSLDRHLETSHEALDMLSRNLDKSARLISSFKQVASDQKTDIRRRFNLDKLVHDTAQSLKTALCESGCRLDRHIDPAIELDSYPDSLSQVVTAIIENALVHAYANSPGGTITINAEYQNAAVKLSILDTGKGIPPENLPRIFDPFFTTRLGQGGSGLGLHIVYNTVTNILNGQITAESTPGKGSCFTITLPIGS